MKAINDSKASEAQASSHMNYSGATESLEGHEAKPDDQNGSLKIDDLDFLVELPTISALDLDVLKLTAQFAAKNGKQFILHLSQKESRNPQFDFLKPHHNLNPFYQDLVKQYTLVLNPPKDLFERVKRCAFNKNDHLKLVKQRVQIEMMERQRILEQEAEQNAEIEAFSKIDWHDFNVAETVNFGPEDQHKDLPGPLNLQILQSMPITQRLEMWTGRKAESEIISNTVVSVVEEDDEEMEIDEPNDFATPLITPIIPTVSKPNEIIMGAAFGSGSSIKVRTDYVPRAVASSNDSASTQICSICNASVPISQIEEHIRIELLDPKWRTQRLAMMVKNKESNLVETGTDVSKNLEAFAKQRQDIFTPSSSTNSSSSSIERGPSRPIWDGRADSVGQINRAAQILAKPQIEKEMEALQKSGDYSLDPSKGIGPRVPTQMPQGYPSTQPTQGYPFLPPPQGYLPMQGYQPLPQGYPPIQGYPPLLPPPPPQFPHMPPGFPQVPQGYPPIPIPPNMQFPPQKPEEKKK
jgi:splicing factor 3A subunit 1